MIDELDGDRASEVIHREGRAVLVDFWSPWCAPCRTLRPHLDRLAGQGARFDAMFSQAPRALPGSTTLLTSLPPEQHGVVRNDLALSGEATTLAEVMFESGFATAAFVSGAALDPKRGLLQGFETIGAALGYRFYIGHTDGSFDEGSQVNGPVTKCVFYLAQ